MDKKECLADRIFGLLEKNQNGLIISEISHKLNATKYKVRVACAELNGAGIVDVLNVGCAKLVRILKKEEN